MRQQQQQQQQQQLQRQTSQQPQQQDAGCDRPQSSSSGSPGSSGIFSSGNLGGVLRSRVFSASSDDEGSPPYGSHVAGRGVPALDLDGGSTTRFLSLASLDDASLYERSRAARISAVPLLSRYRAAAAAAAAAARQKHTSLYARSSLMAAASSARVAAASSLQSAGDSSGAASSGRGGGSRSSFAAECKGVVSEGKAAAGLGAEGKADSEDPGGRERRERHSRTDMSLDAATVQAIEQNRASIAAKLAAAESGELSRCSDDDGGGDGCGRDDHGAAAGGTESIVRRRANTTNTL